MCKNGKNYFLDNYDTIIYIYSELYLRTLLPLYEFKICYVNVRLYRISYTKTVRMKDLYLHSIMILLKLNFYLLKEIIFRILFLKIFIK